MLVIEDCKMQIGKCKLEILLLLSPGFSADKRRGARLGGANEKTS